jgi:outer membrane receptor protein involved in Fe transport
MIKSKQRSNLMIFCIALCIIAFLGTGPLSGQSVQYGKITGKVFLADTSEPVAGIMVEITSDALVSGKRSTVSNVNGTYVFLNLPVGKYTIKASLESFKTTSQKGLRISSGRVVTVNLLMEKGEIREIIQVTATAPMVDVKTSAVDSKINKELLEKLPTSRDAFYDLSLTTPGMFDGGSEASWLPSPYAYGGSSNENVFLVNGVNTTNPRGASWGSLVRVNYNAVEEVRILSLGSKAEYGSFSGAAIDVLTKSGSNKLRGNLSFYSQLGTPADNGPAANEDYGTDWIWANEGDDLATVTDKDLELNFTLGGPLVKDKVWFYAGFAYTDVDTKVPIFEPLKGFTSKVFDIKVTAEPNTKMRAWVSYHHENNDNVNESWSTTWDPEMVYGVNKVNHTFSTQLQFNLSDVSTFTAKYLGFWTNDNPNIPDGVPDHPGYINWWKWAAVGVNGAFPYVEAQKSSRHTLQADISHYAEDFLGEHDIKFGVQYTKGRGNWQGGYFHGYANFAYPYRWTQNINYMKSWYGDTGLIMYNRQEHLNPFLTVRTSDSLGLFFDDQWTVGDRLTFNLGFRYDRMSTKYGVGKVYEFANTPADINSPTVLRDREASDNVFDFKTISPRFGLTYMLTKDGKTVIRANYGRYYMPISVENLRRFGPDMPMVNRTMLFYNIPWDIVDVNGNDYVDYNEVITATRAMHGTVPYNSYTTATDISWELSVGPDVKDQHTDQFTLSLERELARDLSIEASYIYKRTANLIVNWPINRSTGEPYAYDRVPHTTEYGQSVELYNVILQDFNGDGAIDGGDVQWVNNNTDFEVINMPDIDGITPQRKYQGIQFVLRKRYSNRWQLMASALFSKSDGSASRSKRQDHFIEGPMVTDDLWVGSLNQLVNNMEGPLPFTPRFELKISGSYKIPVVEVDLGFRFRFNNGRPLWPLTTVPTRSPWGNPAGSVVATGGGSIVGVDPNNPDYLPGPKILDLSLGRNFKLGNLGNIAFNLDILNVFNDGTPALVDWSNQLGRVMALVGPRKIRLNIRFDF